MGLSLRVNTDDVSECATPVYGKKPHLFSRMSHGGPKSTLSLACKQEGNWRKHNPVIREWLFRWRNNKGQWLLTMIH